MLQKGCYSTKIKYVKMYTLEIYPLYGTHFVNVLCTKFNYWLLNTFTDHKYEENLTHAQTTITRPSCSPNQYISENSAWD